MNTYKILSLDGGGSWALIQAKVLLDLNRENGDIRGHELLRQFDMAIANSGGALVLACLCNDMKLSEIIAVFKDEDKRKQVFTRLTFLDKLKWRNLISVFTRALGPRYNTEKKLTGLQNLLKANDHLYQTRGRYIVDETLNDLPAIIGKPDLQIVIAGFDYFRQRVSFFRSNANSLTNQFSANYFKISLGYAIHSSSNAPVNYFDAPAEVNISLLTSIDNRKTWYWDGAVAGFNNPVLAGLIEAITNNYKDPKEYYILSIGTGAPSKAVLTDYKDSDNPVTRAIFKNNKDNPLAITDTSFGFTKDLTKLAKSILGDPPDSASFIAYSILDPSLSNKANLIRINPCITPVKNIDGKYVTPSVYLSMKGGESKFQTLIEMDMDAVEDKQVNLINEFCDKFIASTDLNGITNQLIRGEEGKVHLGQPYYYIAKEKWLNCK